MGRFTTTRCVVRARPRLAIVWHVCLVGLAASACSERSERVVLPTPVVVDPGPAGPLPESTIFAVEPHPLALLAGRIGVLRVRLTRPAPPDGLIVSLSADETMVVVPAEVIVPHAAVTADVPIRAGPVPSDRVVTLSGTATGRTATGALRLWAEVPTFLSFVSDPEVGSTVLWRETSDTSVITARCTGNAVEVSVQRPGGSMMRATFRAPAGTPLIPGSYEGAVRFPGPGQPGLDMNVASPCTPAVGRFDVHEANLTATGEVRRFRATFEQRCTASDAGMQGDVAFTSVSPPSFTACAVE